MKVVENEQGQVLWAADVAKVD